MKKKNGKHSPANGNGRKATPARGECTIPPTIPHTALPGLVFKRDDDAERRIREYVEWQAPDEKVTHAERVAVENVMGTKHEAWDVRTDKARWWVITGPTNLYSQELFPSLDYTITFHLGLIARMSARREPGIESAERDFLLPIWRRWEQAVAALDEAEEAEEFQAVGMRCRECLKAIAKSMARREMIQEGKEVPKRGDFLAWSEVGADYLLAGNDSERVRSYVKAVSKATWSLVNWLTHAGNARGEDAKLAADGTQHVMAVFGRALFRHKHGIPDRCPDCGSYRIGLRADRDDATTSEAVPACHECGWREQRAEPAPTPVLPS